MTKRIPLIAAIFIVFIWSAWRISKSWTFEFFTPIIRQVNTEKPVLALTIDDGPSEGRIDAIVSLLDSLDVKATFFITGRELERNPENGKRLITAGHELANHSYSHSRMILKLYSFVDREIFRTDSLIRNAAQRGEIYFRAPYFKKLFILPFYLKKHDRKMIGWNIAPDSYPGLLHEDAILKYVASGLEPGSIMLVHLWYSTNDMSLRMLPDIVRVCRQKGYRFLTLSKLLSEKK
jgi:peptidoglycan-N-acetylglucosamine deacetylase